MDFLSTGNILVHIPLGAGGYDLSWIEAIGTLFGLLCIWFASKEKIINYLFGLINVTLFAVIFFQINSTPACYYSCFLWCQYLRLVCLEQTNTG